MRDLRTLLRDAEARLSGADRARYLLRQIDRKGLVTGHDIRRLQRAAPQEDGPARADYLTTVKRWADARGLNIGLTDEAIIGPVGCRLECRWFIVQRISDYSKETTCPYAPEDAWREYEAWYAGEVAAGRQHHLLTKATFIRHFEVERDRPRWMCDQGAFDEAKRYRLGHPVPQPR